MEFLGHLGPLTVVLLLCLCLNVSARKSNGTDWENFVNAWESYPHGQAERLIKGLNLLPGLAEGSLEGENDDSYMNGPRLVEKRVHLGIEGNATVTTEELGHYAGYFKLARSHAARCSQLETYRYAAKEIPFDLA